MPKWEPIDTLFARYRQRLPGTQTIGRRGHVCRWTRAPDDYAVAAACTASDAGEHVAAQTLAVGCGNAMS